MAALAPLVSAEELAGWLRTPLAGADAEWAELVLSAVSALIRSEAGQTWETTSVPEQVRAVAFTVAARVYRNPEAATSYSRTTGPFGKSVTFSDPTAVGLFLSAQERSMLGRLNTKRRGLWTLSTTRAQAAEATTFVPVEGSTSGFPWYGRDELL